MSSVSKTILVGNLGADPEKKSFQNGGSVVNMRLATTKTWRDKNGDRQERTSWHAITIRNEKVGDIAMQYCRKGSKIYVEGMLDYREYEKDGQKHRVAEIVIEPYNGKLTLLDGRDPGEGANQKQASNSTANHGGRANAGGASRFDHAMDDEIPF